MVRKIFLTILCGTLLAGAQTKVDIERQARSTGFLAPPFQAPLRSGEALPSSCVVGELYFLKSASPGANIHVCHAPGEWVPQGSSGQANVTIRGGGDLVGTRSTLNFSAGAGIVQTLGDSGSAVDLQYGVDTALVMTKAASQSGAALFCDAALTGADLYTCAMSPALTAYTTGMVLHWRPSAKPAGSEPGLNINLLGAKRIRMADGVSDPRPEDIVGGQVYALWYDGTQFRLLASVIPEAYLTAEQQQGGAAFYCESAGTSLGAYSCSVSPALAAYRKGMVLLWRPDVPSDGSAVSLNVDALGAVGVKLRDGLTAPAAGDIAGGEIYPIWFDGAAFRLMNTPPKPFLLPAQYQSAAALRCEATEVAAGSFECALSPKLTSYVRGMVLHFLPDAAAAGPITLDVDQIGAKRIKLADGVMDPVSGDLRVGQMYT
ncbi:MAG: hypothetical protein LC114_14740, partial [Bryobacterales bacterium]|nr:hypothetical protein [Bryobacterales bacterium]